MLQPQMFRGDLEQQDDGYRFPRRQARGAALHIPIGAYKTSRLVRDVISIDFVCVKHRLVQALFVGGRLSAVAADGWLATRSVVIRCRQT